MVKRIIIWSEGKREKAAGRQSDLLTEDVISLSSIESLVPDEGSERYVRWEM